MGSALPWAFSPAPVPCSALLLLRRRRLLPPVSPWSEGGQFRGSWAFGFSKFRFPLFRKDLGQAAVRLVSVFTSFHPYRVTVCVWRHGAPGAPSAALEGRGPVFSGGGQDFSACGRVAGSLSRRDPSDGGRGS